MCFRFVETNFRALPSWSGSGSWKLKNMVLYFYCFTTRVVWLEVCESMSCDSFPNAFFRFSGLPHQNIKFLLWFYDKNQSFLWLFRTFLIIFYDKFMTNFIDKANFWKVIILLMVQYLHFTDFSTILTVTITILKVMQCKQAAAVLHKYKVSPVYTVHSRVVYTFWLYGVHFRKVSREKNIYSYS